MLPNLNLLVLSVIISEDALKKYGKMFYGSTNSFVPSSDRGFDAMILHSSRRYATHVASAYFKPISWLMLLSQVALGSPLLAFTFLLSMFVALCCVLQCDQNISVSLSECSYIVLYCF